MNCKYDVPAKLLSILDRIYEKGEVYFVGGCVRDILMGKKPHDYDIVTNLRPNKIIELFPNYNTNLVGESFGVVVVDGFEIATFRKDIYSAEQIHTKGADSVEFANTIEEDLSRRDISINAVAIRIVNSATVGITHISFIDPYNGREDIKNGVIKFVGHSEDRIREDPCRILRAIRFRCQFGFNYTSETMYAIDNNRALFFLIAPERIRLEIMKVLERSDKPSKFIEDLHMYNLLQYIFPPLYECYDVGGGIYHNETVYKHNLLAMDSVSKKYPLIRLAALLHDIGKPQSVCYDEMRVEHFYGHEGISAELAKMCLENLKFSTKEVEYIYELIVKHMFFFEEITKDSTYRRFMSKLKVPVRHLLRVRIADRRGNTAKKDRPIITHMFRHVLGKIRKIEKEDQCLKISDLEINGNDLIALGYAQGPIIGKILKRCLYWVIKHPSFNTERILKHIVSMEFLLEGGNKCKE